ncbi:DUF308 domain-containing protein [Mycobacterium sp. shizuoka-1]|uniref:DUF308 domain-containing protein n=1 Tax=Mycobacterium sp. shizuoka-1 TaxID=2039281 RepID=UPI000C066AAF|nr:DUF308 domain-containing protein [Mycobacterium sp. shizuoka-1]GAY14189.1 membrane protein [Mycobacterium sp. shizuoka-1]
MSDTLDRTHGIGIRTWLERYYYARAAFSLAWVAAAFTLAGSPAAVIATLLLIYPAWDAAANLVDAQHNGGLRRNPTQAVNAAVSAATTLAVAVALTSSMNAVLGVFGVWAALAGLLQLGTGVRRWKNAGGQWPMVVSGIQSAVAGVSFLVQAGGAEVPRVSAIAPYAAFGAFYFLLSALWLTVGDARRRRS